MAIAFSTLEDSEINSSQSSYSTGTLSPTAGALVLATCVVLKNSGLGADPTISGLGVTWNKIVVDTGLSGSANPVGIYLFATQAASYTTGTITFSPPAAPTECGWNVEQVTGTAVDFAAQGLGVIPQSGHASTTNGTSVGTNVLPNALISTPQSASYSAMFANSNTEVITQAAGYTQGTGWVQALFGQGQNAWKVSGDRSPSWSSTNPINYTLVAVEVAAPFDIPLLRPTERQVAQLANYRM